MSTALEVDPATAAAARLRRDLGVLSLRAEVLGHDAEPDRNPWVFARHLLRTVEGTGRAAIVVYDGSPWASPNRHNSAAFPSITAAVFADRSRYPDGSPAADDAAARAWTVWRRIDAAFHDVGQVWADLHVVSSLRNADPSVQDVPGGGGVVRLTARYELVLI